MDLDTVHINPVTPDPSASGRYASSDERSPSDREDRPDPEKQADDRLEISDRGRRTYLAHVAPPDMDFARKALDRLPATDGERAMQLAARIESGYYVSRAVIEQVVARMVPYG